MTPATIDRLNKIITMFAAPSEGERVSAYNRFSSVIIQHGIDPRDLQLIRAGVDEATKARKAQLDEALRIAYPDAAKLSDEILGLKATITELRAEVKELKGVSVKTGTNKIKLDGKLTEALLREKEEKRRLAVAEKDCTAKVLSVIKDMAKVCRQIIGAVQPLRLDKIQAAEIPDADLLDALDILFIKSGGRDVLPVKDIPADLRLILGYVNTYKKRKK